MEGDPALKGEFEFQKQIVESVKHARAVELKAMLNNVPVGGGSWGAGKIAAGVISAGIVATSLYFYFNDEEVITNTTEETQQEVIQPSGDENKAENAEVAATDEATKDGADETGANNSKEIAKDIKSKVSKPVQKPDIQVVDPSEELTEEKDTNVTPGRSEISTSKMEVITESSDKKHTFHYQFVQGKLLLYGPFDKSLYEILEIHGEGHAVFLFYRENYYMLDERQSKITPLGAIQDTELLKKLKEYRGR
jgi:hypothetical protein